jgi:HPt (histidine-containing phosphotransfer) domain-containing protein
MNSLDLSLNNIFDDVLLKPFSEKELAEKLVMHSGKNSKFTPDKSRDHNSQLESNSSSLYSLNLLKTTAGRDGAFILHMLNLYLKNSRANLERIKEAIDSNNADDITDIAHKMIPSSRQIEAAAVVKLLKQMEAAGKDRDIKSAKDIYSSLEQNCSALLHKLEEEIQKIQLEKQSAG